ncbi:hypothetical protein N9N67_01470 [Bacteriovoracaceae bacterium]|nr:hypothetical protein [Bacteriovoracaceae bacterium]
MHQTIYLIVFSILFHLTDTQGNIIDKAKSKLGLKKKCQTNLAKIQICTKDFILHGSDSIGKVKKIYTKVKNRSNSDLIVKLLNGDIVRFNINDVSKVLKKKCHTIQTPNHKMVKEKKFCKNQLIYSEINSPSEIGKIKSLYYIVHDMNKLEKSSDLLGIISWKQGEKTLENMKILEASIQKSPIKNIFSGQVALYPNKERSTLSVGRVKAVFSNGLALTKPYMQDLENKIILDTADLSGSINCINGVRIKDQVMIENSPQLKVMHAFDNGTLLVKSKKKYNNYHFVDSHKNEIHSADLSDEECQATPKVKKNFLKKLFKKISQISIKKMLKRDAREPLDDEMN